MKQSKLDWKSRSVKYRYVSHCERCQRHWRGGAAHGVLLLTRLASEYRIGMLSLRRRSSSRCAAYGRYGRWSLRQVIVVLVVDRLFERVVDLGWIGSLDILSVGEDDLYGSSMCKRLFIFHHRDMQHGYRYSIARVEVFPNSPL